jgi:SAM-dependent methyltransferase
MKKLRRSHSIHLSWDREGFLTGLSSLSRKPVLLTRDDLLVLDYFSQPRELERAKKACEALMKPEDLKERIDYFIERGILTCDEDESSPSLASGTFATIGQHVTMLNEHVRVRAYQEAIKEIAKAGDVVGDLGCGTGILGIFALKSGAERILAIEESTIINIAREIYRINDCAEKVRFFAGNSLNVSLPEEVDLIISELMNTDPLAEGMLEILLDARKRFLKPGGRMIPGGLKLFARPVETPLAQAVKENIDSHIEGLSHFHKLFDMKIEPLAKRFLLEPLPSFTLNLKDAAGEDRTKTLFLGDERLIADIDLLTFQNATVAGENSFDIRRDGMLNGVAFYFSALLSPGKTLSNAPEADYSLNWGGQTVYLLSTPEHVKKGDVVSFRFYSGHLSGGRLRVTVKK